MDNNIKNKIEGRKKTNVNLTIDISLREALEEYKKNHSIKELSPMVNEMLWSWIKQEKESKKDS